MVTELSAASWARANVAKIPKSFIFYFLFFLSKFFDDRNLNILLYIALCTVGCFALARGGAKYIDSNLHPDVGMNSMDTWLDGCVKISLLIIVDVDTKQKRDNPDELENIS